MWIGVWWCCYSLNKISGKNSGSLNGKCYNKTFLLQELLFRHQNQPSSPEMFKMRKDIGLVVAGWGFFCFFPAFLNSRTTLRVAAAKRWKGTTNIQRSSQEYLADFQQICSSAAPEKYCGPNLWMISWFFPFLSCFQHDGLGSAGHIWVPLDPFALRNWSWLVLKGGIC